MQSVFLILIHWIVIYPIDSAIRLLNNLDLTDNPEANSLPHPLQPPSLHISVVVFNTRKTVQMLHGNEIRRKKGSEVTPENRTRDHSFTGLMILVFKEKSALSSVATYVTLHF